MQRVRKTHPEGGLIGLGMSPDITIRRRLRVASTDGTADSSASV
jgi:hypothetical protein